MLSMKTALLLDYSSHRNIETNNPQVLTVQFEEGASDKISKQMKLLHTSYKITLVLNVFVLIISITGFKSHIFSGQCCNLH